MWCCRGQETVSLGIKLPNWTNGCYNCLSDSNIQRRKCSRYWKLDYEKDAEMLLIMTSVNNCCQMLRGCCCVLSIRHDCKNNKQNTLWPILPVLLIISPIPLSLFFFTCYHILPSTSFSFSFCASFLQEGQVLECSLINSIRVGSVPKVRPPERQFPRFSFHNIHSASASVRMTFRMTFPHPVIGNWSWNSQYAPTSYFFSEFLANWLFI